MNSTLEFQHTEQFLWKVLEVSWTLLESW
jgi:hypothetical protein